MKRLGVEPSTESGRAPALFSVWEKRILFGLLAALFVALSAFTLRAYLSEANSYSDLLTRARAVNTCSENLLMFEVALAPFRSLATVRAAALFLSFVLVIMGALFVLSGIEVAYRINLEAGEGKKAALETASPGLVLVTAGSLLVVASLYRSGSPEFKPILGCTGKTSAVQSALDALSPQPEKP